MLVCEGFLRRFKLRDSINNIVNLLEFECWIVLVNCDGPSLFYILNPVKEPHYHLSFKCIAITVTK